MRQAYLATLKTYELQNLLLEQLDRYAFSNAEHEDKTNQLALIRAELAKRSATTKRIQHEQPAMSMPITLAGVANMNIKTAIQYVRQYRKNGKSCYIHSTNRYDCDFITNHGIISFVCHKCHYSHGGNSKWWRAYLRFENGKAVPSKLFTKLVEI